MWSYSIFFKLRYVKLTPVLIFWAGGKTLKQDENFRFIPLGGLRQFWLGIGVEYEYPARGQ
jgi:hypothetical protein